MCVETCRRVRSVVFLFRFDSPWFFLLMTKIHCLNGINISEIAPSPSAIIYILEQENSKLLKDIILPLCSAYLQRNILLRGKKAPLVTIISGRHPRRVANLFFINAKDKLKQQQKKLTELCIYICSLLKYAYFPQNVQMKTSRIWLCILYIISESICTILKLAI